MKTTAGARVLQLLNWRVAIMREQWSHLSDGELCDSLGGAFGYGTLIELAGRTRRTEVWISREVMVGFLLYRPRLAASVASLSNMSFLNEFTMDMALE